MIVEFTYRDLDDRHGDIDGRNFNLDDVPRVGDRVYLPGESLYSRCGKFMAILADVTEVVWVPDAKDGEVAAYVECEMDWVWIG